MDLGPDLRFACLLPISTFELSRIKAALALPHSCIGARVRLSPYSLCLWGQGSHLSSQKLSHKLSEAIHLAHKSTCRPAPPNLKAHSTRGVVVSTALLCGWCVSQIYNTLSWASPSPFVRFYRTQWVLLLNSCFHQNFILWDYLSCQIICNCLSLVFQ